MNIDDLSRLLTENANTVVEILESLTRKKCFHVNSGLAFAKFVEKIYIGHRIELLTLIKSVCFNTAFNS